jgi:hypothetical protein
MACDINWYMSTRFHLNLTHVQSFYNGELYMLPPHQEWVITYAFYLFLYYYFLHQIIYNKVYELNVLISCMDNVLRGCNTSSSSSL